MTPRKPKVVTLEENLRNIKVQLQIVLEQHPPETPALQQIEKYIISAQSALAVAISLAETIPPEKGG